MTIDSTSCYLHLRYAQMDEYTKANQISWDTKVATHLTSKFYGLDSFKAGRCSLQSIEVEELGDLSGRPLLHLQCHFGQDTLSWARRGAIVTGIDFSPEAIKQAKTLATELDIEAKCFSERHLRFA